MNQNHPSASTHSLNLGQALKLGALAALVAVAQLGAQTSYTVVDLSHPGSFAIANGTSAGVTVGATASSASLATHAALWSGPDYTDLHPAALLGELAPSRSAVNGAAGGLQVGVGSGANSLNRPVALAWTGTAASASILNVNFPTYSTQALATDGSQIVGYGIGYSRDGTTLDSGHALLWDGANSFAADLGTNAQALGVGGGQQAGQVWKSTWNAALWRGTSKSLVVLHPAGATSSSATATDGVRQVGNATYEIRLRVEAVKGQKSALFSYATVWSGTAGSAINIHPYGFTHSYATSVAGSYIAGYAADNTKLSTPAYYHAIVWDANLQATDLNAFLPAGFVGSQARSVDAAGYVAGYMMTATGERHAVLWIPNL